MSVVEIVKLVRRLAAKSRREAVEVIISKVPEREVVWALQGYEKLRKRKLWPNTGVNK